jgi:hypothetical protein
MTPGVAGLHSARAWSANNETARASALGGTAIRIGMAHF